MQIFFFFFYLFKWKLIALEVLKHSSNFILLPFCQTGAFLFRPSYRTWLWIAHFELLHLALIHLMCMLRLELTARLNVVFAVGKALDYADDIVTFGIGEGNVGIPFGC